MKELKDMFENARTYNDMHWLSPVTKDDMLELIDEAVARQSVTSEGVQEAIEYLQPLTEHPIMSGNFAKHIKTAITALQAYQPWISVSERKPTESELRNGMVLAWSTELSEWQVESWGYVEDRPEDYTHWKPLPEPPKGE